MFQWLADLLWGVLVKLGEWLLSIILWLFEWLYELVSAFLSFIVGIIGEILEKIVSAVAEYLPSGWTEEVTAIYPLLQYIDSWVPISYGIKLLLAYYSMKAVMIPIRWVLKAIPGVWG